MTVADIGCGMGYFSLGMARLVGENGSVLAVDIQQKMLHTMLRRTEKQGLVGRIRPVLADKRDIGIREPVDFVLAFWMVHETEDVSRFLGQVFSLLNKGGTVLIAEPRMHVPERKFREILQHARAAGFQVGKGPDVRISRSALLSKR
jgi:ubiquinone/menaquinone biosynthesis C-methylase UbiE